jgi:hypothetical protein
VFERLDKVADPWAGFWQGGVSLAAARRKLTGMLARSHRGHSRD